MAKPQIEPGDIEGTRKALEFLEGTITLEQLNHWALASLRDAPDVADRHSRVVAMLVLKLHAVYGDEFLTPVLIGLTQEARRGRPW